jgi:DNA-binding IclR family transcriptional regulator
VTEDDVLAFVQKSVKSVWALELLLLLRREKQRSWRPDDLVRELRSSQAAVGGALDGLRSAGFVDADAGELYRYAPASPELDEMAGSIEAVYAAKPMAVAKAIMSAPNDKLRIFADAFKLKDK